MPDPIEMAETRRHCVSSGESFPTFHVADMRPKGTGANYGVEKKTTLL
jgi:hypothetical protein